MALDSGLTATAQRARSEGHSLRNEEAEMGVYMARHNEILKWYCWVHLRRKIS